MDYFDQLKSRTRRATHALDYEFDEYKPGSMLVKLDILLSGKPIDALSFIVHKDKAYDRGRVLCEKLKDIIPQPDVRGAHPGGHRRPRACPSKR